MHCLYVSLFLSVALACQHNGKTYEDGDEWIDTNRYKLRCTISSGKSHVEVIGCVALNGTVMPMNGETQIDDKIWECKRGTDGRVQFGPKVVSSESCGDHENGSEWDEGAYRYKCGEGNVKEFVGCIGAGQFVPNGEIKEMSDFFLECKKHENGTITLLVVPDTKCKDSGGRKVEEGSEWLDGSMKFTCGKGGKKKFMGCYTSSGDFVPNGKTQSVNGFDVECKQHANGTIEMQILGRSMGVNCKDDGGIERDQGSEWEEGVLRFRCGKKGITKLIGCVTPSKILIPNGDVKSVS